MRPALFSPFALLISTVIFAQATFAGTPADQAARFVDRLGRDAIALLKTETMSAEEKENGLRALLRAGMDLPRISRYVLGNHWKRATAEQQAVYQEVFGNYVLLTYSRLIATQRVTGFQVTGTESPKGKDVFVHTSIDRPDGETLKWVWRVRETKRGPRIIDLATGGVSLVATQHAEFRSVVAAQGLDGLIAALRKKI